MHKQRLRRYVNFWGFVGIAAFLVFVYPIQRLSAWLDVPYASGWQVMLVLWLLILLGLWLSFTARVTVLKPLLMNWMGAGFILMCVCAVCDVLLLLTDVDRVILGWGAILVASVLSLTGAITALRLNNRFVRISSPKLSRKYRMVQISDVHIGSRSAVFLNHVVRRINELEPDLVVITGDLLDTGKVGSAELAALGDLTAPGYFIVGNHERYVGLDYVVPMVEALGVKAVRNQSALVGDLQLIGIDDAEDPEQVSQVLSELKIHPARFRVLLYHKPSGWDSARDVGIELMLSGHTHNGQIMPFNLLVKRQFKNILGMYRRGDSCLYVSPGTGTWGPVIRLGSRNEITCFDLAPGASG